MMRNAGSIMKIIGKTISRIAARAVLWKRDTGTRLAERPGKILAIETATTLTRWRISIKI
jgi:hypothetical protein